jgi:sulfate adenylyltransferase
MHDARQLPSIQLSERSTCDLELLATGAFSPLDGFMRRADYESVIHDMRLTNGLIFPIPITLPVTPGAPVHLDQALTLRDSRNEILAVLTVEEIYPWDRREAARSVCRTNDTRHPLVAEMEGWGRLNIAGRLRVLRLPRHHDFSELRLTPAQVRARLAAIGHPNVLAFQTRNPLHRVHEELTKRAAREVDGTLLLHPVVGLTKPGDIDHYTRVRTYKVMVERYYDRTRVLLALLPLAMRLAGPREALWHALIRRNFGATHLIVGRDHASPGLDSQGRPFYEPYDAQRLVEEHSAELGIRMLPFRELVYLQHGGRYVEDVSAPDHGGAVSISGTQVRNDYLNNGRRLPEWFTRPEVADILAEAYRPRHRQGVCVWFTGLSGAGKSTTAEILTVLLLEHGRQVTVLDGDVARTHLSQGLGFSREDRDANVRRIGFVAAEIVRHGGVAVCAAVSPYRSTREEVRSAIGADRFVEVFVDTPLAICQQRDQKGLYARARAGGLRGMTAIDDPYEPPWRPEISLDTVAHSAEDNARKVLGCLVQRGFVRPDTWSPDDDAARGRSASKPGAEGVAGPR